MTYPLNVLWMVADHQAYANHGGSGAHAPLQSRLAGEGVVFPRAYTVLPVCSPARASMLTGLYPHAHGLTENDGRFGGRPGLGADDRLVHQVFARAGYRCAWFGKWHLHHTKSATDFGFEGFSLPGYGYPYGTDRYRRYLDRAGLPLPQAEIELPGESGLPRGTRINLCDEQAWFDYEAGAALLLGPAEVHEAFFVARLAEDWLESLGGEAFFLRVDPWGPHPPYLLAAPYTQQPDPAAIELPANFWSDLRHRPAHHRAYRDQWQHALGLDAHEWRRMVARARQQVALVEAALLRVLNAVDRLGLRERTLVIFTADHGDAVGSNGGVSNKGALMVEETLRVPLVIRGPGIEGGRRCHRLAANFDIAPSILELCGLNSGFDFHGTSLAGVLRGAEGTWRGGLVTEHYGLHQPIVQRAYHSGPWKLVVQEDGFTELYHLEADPCEMANLATAPGKREVLERMFAGLHEAMEETGDDDERLACIRCGPSL